MKNALGNLLEAVHAERERTRKAHEALRQISQVVTGGPNIWNPVTEQLSLQVLVIAETALNESFSSPLRQTVVNYVESLEGHGTPSRHGDK